MADYDHEVLLGIIGTAAKSSTSGAEALGTVIDYCARVKPHKDWPSFRSLDLSSDVSRIVGRLGPMLREHPIPLELDGVYFGLCNPVDEGSRRKGGVTADAYVGANRYDNEDPDWACDLAWRAEGFLGSLGLQEMYRLAYGPGQSGLGNDAEYPVGLTYAALLARDLVRTMPALILGEAAGRYIAVGFDSGDLLCVGHVDCDGLLYSVEHERFA